MKRVLNFNVRNPKLAHILVSLAGGLALGGVNQRTYLPLCYIRYTACNKERLCSKETL